MSTNISKQKREDLLNKIKEIRTYISAAPQDENTGNKDFTYDDNVEKAAMQLPYTASCLYQSLF